MNRMDNTGRTAEKTSCITATIGQKAMPEVGREALTTKVFKLFKNETDKSQDLQNSKDRFYK